MKYVVYFFLFLLLAAVPQLIGVFIIGWILYRLFEGKFCYLLAPLFWILVINGCDG